MTILARPGLAGGSVLLLLAWLGLWLGVAEPPAVGPPLLAVLMAWLPLAPAVPSIFRGNRRAAGWSSMAGVFYSGFAIMELVANPPARLWASVAFLLSILMIGLQIVMIRHGPSQPG